MSGAQRIHWSINLSGHFLLWGVAFWILCPAPLGLGAFTLARFEPGEMLLFFLYGFVLNVLLFYGFSLSPIPRYLGRNWIVGLALKNTLWYFSFIVLESVLDVLFEAWASGRAAASMQYPAWSFWAWVSTNLVVSGLVLFAANLYSFTASWFRDRERQRELEQEKLRAELKALKHQINPHFLFNVLNSLYGLAFQNEDEPTAEGIAKLSQLMRYMLYESNDTETSLEKELEYLDNYISLQQLRLNVNTVVKIDIHGPVVGTSIAPMVLIPFVENAFKFGISTAHESFVHIFLSVDEQELVFWVENRIHEVNTPEGLDEVGGIGLANLRKRLELVYPGRYLLHTGPEGPIYRAKLTIIL